jgi:hypothetical protein
MFLACFCQKSLFRTNAILRSLLRNRQKPCLKGRFEGIFADFRAFLPVFASFLCIFLQNEGQIGACT